MLKFNNGAVGNLWVSQTTAGRKNCLRYEIAGEKSALYWDSQDPNNLWLGYRDKPNERLHRDPGLLAANVRPYANYPGGHNEGFPDTFKQCFRAFYSFIANGDMKAKPEFPTFLQGHEEIVLCEAILQSHREQKWVEL
jgi:predicted dehydrogenase